MMQVVSYDENDALLEEVLGPDDAVNGLRWRVSYGASWKGLLGGFRLAFVALCHSLGNEEREDREGKKGRQRYRETQ